MATSSPLPHADSSSPLTVAEAAYLRGRELVPADTKDEATVHRAGLAEVIKVAQNADREAREHVNRMTALEDMYRDAWEEPQGPTGIRKRGVMLWR